MFGAWPDPRRRSARQDVADSVQLSPSRCSSPVCPRALSPQSRMHWRAVRVALEAVSWPLFALISLTMFDDASMARGLSLSIATALVIRERWRDVRRRRDELDLDAFLRALDQDDAYAPTLGVARRIAAVHERATLVECPSERTTVPDS